MLGFIAVVMLHWVPSTSSSFVAVDVHPHITAKRFPEACTNKKPRFPNAVIVGQRTICGDQRRAPGNSELGRPASLHFLGAQMRLELL